MAKVMIVGASVLQVPLIKKAQEKGHQVVALDMNPEAVGVPLADEFANESTTDREGMAKAAAAYAVDGIVTMATDQPLVAIAYACSRQGLRSISEEAAARATQKHLMREALVGANVLCPVSMAVSDVADALDAWDKLGGPVIIKPSDSSGSRGVTLTEDRASVEGSIRGALGYSRIGVAVVEEFVEGREFSVESVLLGADQHVIQVTEKETFGPPNFVEAGHFQPANVTEAERDMICDAAGLASVALGIEDSPIHAEIMLKDGKAYVVELGARLGGDYITSDLVPLSTGVDMLSLVIDLSLGVDIQLSARHNRAATSLYFSTGYGRIKEIVGLDRAMAIQGVERVELFVQPGDVLSPITGSDKRAGCVITSGATRQEAESVARECREVVEFITITE